MPLGNNEIQVVIECFTLENPSFGIQFKAQSLIEMQKWNSSEVIYNDQKEELDENGIQWYSFVFIIGVDYVTKDNKKWFADVKTLLDFAILFVSPQGPESTISVCFRSSPYISETVGFINDLSPSENIEKMILDIILAHKRKFNGWMAKLWNLVRKLL